MIETENSELTRKALSRGLQSAVYCISSTLYMRKDFILVAHTNLEITRCMKQNPS